MTKALFKNTFREIKNSKARFISIMAIIALGVGFFAGIKATAPSMYNLARTYCDEQRLMDFRLLSTVGFDEDDISAIASVEGVTSVMPSYFCDVQQSAQDGGEVMRMTALPTAYRDNFAQNELVVKEGRLPQRSGEIAVDAGSFVGGGYKVGDKVSIGKMSGDAKTDTMLKKLEYTVVGVVQSPLYISYQRGATDIGNGKISEFMYIIPEDFAFERFNELYVKTDISDKYEAFTDEYSQACEDMEKVLEDAADERCRAFNTDVILQAKDDLEKAKKEYSDEKEKAEKQLEDGKKQLDDSKKEFDAKINDAQLRLDGARAQLDSGRAELEQKTSDYYAAIESAETQIIQKEGELGAQRMKYNSSKEEFDAQIKAAEEQLEAGWEEYNSAYNTFTQTTEPALTEAIAQAQAAVDGLRAAVDVSTEPAQTAELTAQLNAAQEALDGLNLQYSTATDELEKSKALLEGKQIEFDAQKAQGQKQLDDALALLDDGDVRLAEAKKELEAQKNDGYIQLTAAKAQLDAAQKEYDDGTGELAEQKEDGQIKLDDARAEYDDKKAEADKKFADAEKELEDAQKEVDGLSSPEWYVFDRDDNPGFATFAQNADRLDAVASIFPLFFLLVAVLVCVTTMTRLIEEKRTEIGTFKALGYSNMSIVMKFVIYSLTAAVIGGITGIFIGIYTIPFIIYNAYKIMYYIGDITLTPDYVSIFAGIAAAVLCTTAVAVIVCMRSLHHKPASIMRPKAPKPGKRILLERIKPVWAHMSFNSKLTARNLFRYKSRLCMTVIGVAGCTALIVAAFGLLNSFDPLTKDQFETIYKYNTVVIPKEGGTAEELEYLTDISDDDNTEYCMLAFDEECSLEFEGKLKDADTYLTVMQNPEGSGELISLHTRKGKKELSLQNGGVLINEKLAEEFGIDVGDTVKLDCGSGTCEVKVSGIYEQYIHNYIYMTPDLYSELFGRDIRYNMLDVKLADASQEAENEFGKKMLSDDRIAAVNFVAASLDDFENMLDSLNMVVMVMIICAASLAFVVLYNLTNINIAERVREIATFKVLGFCNRETSAFIYKENLVLTVLGIAAGLVMGVFLTGFIVKTVEVDNIMFGRDIYFTSYLFAAGLTMLFSLLVNGVMSFKIKSVDMVESLKSVE